MTQHDVRTVLVRTMTQLTEAGVWQLSGQPPVPHVERPKNAEHGDWMTNVAFVLARTLKKAPQEIAQELATQVSDELDGARVDVVGGYINITLSDAQYQTLLARIAAAGAAYGTLTPEKSRMILLEYVSANPTGPITLGNARGGPYGDVLANVLTKAGHTVTREYYINDAGNQVDILGHSLLGDEHAQYRGDYIDDLRTRLVTPDAPADARSLGERAAHIIVEEIIKPTLAEAHITFDNWFSEQSLHESGAVDRVIALLKDAGHLYERDGAWYFRATAFGDDKDRVFVKADGSKTYACVDVAYHLDKLTRAEHLINIWGADHGGTVPRLKGALAALGHTDVLDVILTQFVRVMEDGKEVKMSKRRGTYIALSDLVEEVGADVVRFLFLMQAATSHVVFDLDRAREQSEKNPVYYVQYAHARLSSILRKAREQGITDYRGADLAPLTHPKECALIRVLSELPDIIARTAQDYHVHRLPHYAISIADHLHAFYGACKVLDDADTKTTQARLVLVDAARTVLAETLRLIGVTAPEKM